MMRLELARKMYARSLRVLRRWRQVVTSYQGDGVNASVALQPACCPPVLPINE